MVYLNENGFIPALFQTRTNVVRDKDYTEIARNHKLIATDDLFN